MDYCAWINYSLLKRCCLWPARRKDLTVYETEWNWINVICRFCPSCMHYMLILLILLTLYTADFVYWYWLVTTYVILELYTVCVLNYTYNIEDIFLRLLTEYIYNNTYDYIFLLTTYIYTGLYCMCLELYILDWRYFFWGY